MTQSLASASFVGTNEATRAREIHPSSTRFATPTTFKKMIDTGPVSAKPSQNWKPATTNKDVRAATQIANPGMTRRQGNEMGAGIDASRWTAAMTFLTN